MRRLLPLALLALTLVFCASASATSVGYENNASISPADRLPLGQPGYDVQNYPSAIDVSGVSGSVTNVQVTLTGLTSAYPGDLDVMLQSPGGKRVMLMSDTGGGTDVSGLNLTFRDGAAQTLPPSQLASGDYLPTNLDGFDADYIPGAPAAPFGSQMSDLNGGTADGKWELYVVDDATGDTSSIQGWSLELNTTAGKIVSNSSPITGADGGGANPYPSTIDVAGLDRSVANVTISIKNVAFGDAGDADLLLVAPDGRRVMLMSDAQQNIGLSGFNYTFDDSASTVIPQANSAVDGFVQPVNYDPQDDAMPAPAPAGPYGSALSTFKGADPNGRWSLYLADDKANGKLTAINGGWSMNLSLGDTLPQQPASGSTPGSTSGPATAPAAAPQPQAQLPALSLSGLSVAPKAFNAGRGGKVVYRLSRSARVRFTIARKLGAHRFKKVRGSLAQTGAAGANRLRLRGKLGGRKLVAGNYRIVATATDASGHPAASRSATFRVTR